MISSSGPSLSTPPSTLTVALIGNPNTGKSTLFSALAGIHQRVANYPGVTVEKKTGRMDFQGRRYELIDLPGLYSLSPRSRDEMVAVDVLLGREAGTAAVDAVLCIVDGSNLQRNLYLLSQALELGLPMVVAVNMLDVARQRGITVNLAELQRRLGVPVVAVQANRRVGIGALRTALAQAMAGPAPTVETPLPDVFESEAVVLAALLGQRLDRRGMGRLAPRFLAQRLLLDTSGYLPDALLHDDCVTQEAIAAARQRLEGAGCLIPGVETAARYDWARRLLKDAVAQKDAGGLSRTDRIDHFLTHRIWGTAVLIVAMLIVFQAVFVWARPLMAGIDYLTEALGDRVEASMADGALRSLLVKGVIHGAGSVLAFIPQIAILFFFIAILEDCGYMARAAYLMDKLMVRVGLSGKSFLPMLSSFACAVPGIMAARVVENERDRLTTILVTPLLTCSARLPVYALLIAAFIPARTYVWGLVSLQGLTLAGLYLVGILAAVGMAKLLKGTLLRGRAPLFLMELPSYQRPMLHTAFFRVWERVAVFLRCAGTLILAVSILTWAAMYYPNGGKSPQHSFLGMAGKFVEPAVRPLGWDWRTGCAVIASFPAREVVVATMGVIFLPDAPPKDEDETSTRLQTALRNAKWDGSNRPLFNTPVALSVMVFFALCAQCVSTLAIIRRETNSWRWPLFTFSYMTALAYVAAMLTYQVGSWMGLP